MNKPYPRSNYDAYRVSRNPYYTKIREFSASMRHQSVLADEASELHRGRWREFFQAPSGSFLNLELGAYHGETSIELARRSPENLHVGIEWKYKQCFKAGKKAHDQGLKNLSFLRANMARLPWVFAPGELDRVWVLFPDPWSRESQQKWRVLNPGFLRILGCLLAGGKELLIKTDHAEYADYIRDSIEEAKCFSYLPEDKADALFSLIPPTPFERIFLRQGLAIHRFALVRNRELVIPPEEVQHVLR